MPGIDMNLNPKSIRYLTIFSKFSALVFPLLLVSAWVLSFGVWTHAATIEGPFPRDGKAFIVDLRPTLSMSPIFDTGGDTPTAPHRSSLHLAVDGVTWTRAHALHVDLRSGASQSFSHWGNSILFSPGVSAAAPSRIDATYEVRVKPGLEIFLLLAAVLSLSLRSVIAILTGAGLGTLGRLVRWWMIGVWGMSWLLAALSAIYFGSILVAAYLGYALPTAAIFRWIPGGELLDRAMPFTAIPLLVVCALGAAAGWVSRFGALDIHDFQHLEKRLIRFWSLAGLPIVVAVLLLATSAGGWNGRFAPSSMTYQSIAGLVPYSDAEVYYFSAFDMSDRGSWNDVAAQRPLAAAMRGALTLGGGMSYVGSIVLQTIVIACFLVFALRALLIWQGIWVAGAFLALVFGLIQPFLTTSLTEPLGVIWSLVSFAFFIEALRTRSTPHALVGFSAMCLGQVTRMGSMFTIPFLMLWIVAAFSRTRRDALRIGAITLVIVALIMLVNMGLLALFAPNAELAGNFSYVACGLGRGTDWSECATTFADQVKNLDLADKTSFFYMQAVEAFWKEPSLFFHKIIENTVLYVTNIPKLLLSQYSSAIDMSAQRAALLACFCIPGIFAVMGRRPFVLSFWLVLFVSTVFSAALIFGDDGRRALIVTYIFLGGFFALGFTSPATFLCTNGKPSVRWQSGAAIIASILVICIGAAFMLQAHSRTFGNDDPSHDSENSMEIIASSGLTGFLVVPDGTTPDPLFPAVSTSDFRLMFEQSFMQDFGPVVDEALEHMPLAIFIAPRAHGGSSALIYAGPPEILKDRAARRWGIEVRPLGKSRRFLLVQKATINPVRQTEAPED